MRVAGLAVAGGVLAAMAGVVPAAALPSGASTPRPAASAARAGAASALPAGAHAAGATPASTPLRLDIVLRSRNPAGLQAFATAVSTPRSASYHHFLTVAQFAARFAPSPAVIAHVDAELRQAGLPPGPVSANHLVIPVTTTAGRAAAALHIRFESYRLASGRMAMANTLPPRLPPTAARAVQAVIGLNTTLTLAPSLSAPAGPRGRASVSGATGGPQPCAAALSERYKYGAWTYNQLARAYSLNAMYASGAEGRGSTIALFELEPFAASDISAFQACYATNASVTTVSVDGGAGGGAGAEATLDIETAIALAPAAKIKVYEAPNTPTSMLDEYTKIVDTDTAGVLSSSWGECEALINAAEPGLITSENTLFQQAAAEGISVFAAAGDTGSEACYQTDTTMKQQAVQDPASQPYVTSVGGTDLTALGPPPAQSVWNEAAKNAGAGGGGVSSNWTMPPWQAGPGVISGYSSGTPCNNAQGYCREVPDVSASADPLHGYVIFYSGRWAVYAGTSAAAPLWAGILADIESQASPATREGFLNPSLYAMPAGTFTDIVSGNNDYLQPARGLYPATSGFDMASGLGSPIATRLARALGHWAAIEAPLPPDARPLPNNDQRVSLVTCPSSCDAIGSYTSTQGNGGRALLLTGTGITWSPAELQDTALYGEACPSPTSCVVVGWGGYGILFTGWGSSWTSQYVPLPPNASTDPGPAFPQSVVCPSPSQCVVAGMYEDKSGSYQGLLVTGQGTSWASVEAPLPANAAADPHVGLYFVACPSATSCTVAGVYTDSSGNQEGLLLTGAGAAWAATEIPLPAGAAANADLFPASVACQSVSACTVTADYLDASGNSQGLLLTGSGTSWTATKAPLPANAATDASVTLTSTACPSATSCTVAGLYDSTTSQDGLILTGQGSTWKASEAPMPAQGQIMQWLGPVTCVSATACLVTGTYSPSTGGYRGLLLTKSGNSWTALNAPMPANSAKPTSNYIAFHSAACRSAYSCVAVGSYTDTSGYTQPLILSGSIK
jgi:hypothetical protein